MPAVILRRIDPAKNMARFYAIDIQPTLFGDWAVIRRWGRIGTHGRTAETWFAGQDPAVSCADDHETAKRRRGYREAGC